MASNNKTFSSMKLDTSRFDRIIRKKKYYLDPEMTLIKISKLLGTNRSYMSAYVNSGRNISFCDYINNIRLEVAESLLYQPKSKITLDKIAIASGFKSYSTFSRAFMKRYGVTPSLYRKRLFANKGE